MAFENAAFSSERSKSWGVASDSHELAEDRLVDAAKRGHHTAFATLCERYGQQLLRAAHRITRSPENAEDAVKDALMKAFVHVGDFDGRSSFSTWLTRIAINSSLMILRKKRSLLEMATESADELDGGKPKYEIADRSSSPERRYAQQEEKQLLRTAVGNLRPKLREIVRLQQLEERSMGETAKRMGISVAAAKGRLFHAKAALRRSPILKLMQRSRSSGEGRVLSAA